MPYREKIAWLSLVAMAIAFVPYFTLVGTGVFQSDPLPNLRQLIFFGVAAAIQMLVLAAGRLYLRFSSPEDAHVPPDERDEAISRRSIEYAYYVLMAGTVLVGVIMPFRTTGWPVVNGALFSIVAAEVVHYATAALSYRKQS